MAHKNLYDRVALKNDLLEMVNMNPELAQLYINITDHILRAAGHGKLTSEPRGIRISGVAMNTAGECGIEVSYR